MKGACSEMQGLAKHLAGALFASTKGAKIFGRLGRNGCKKLNDNAPHAGLTLNGNVQIDAGVSFVLRCLGQGHLPWAGKVPKGQCESQKERTPND